MVQYSEYLFTHILCIIDREAELTKWMEPNYNYNFGIDYFLLNLRHTHLLG